MRTWLYRIGENSRAEDMQREEAYAAVDKLEKGMKKEAVTRAPSRATKLYWGIPVFGRHPESRPDQRQTPYTRITVVSFSRQRVYAFEC